MKAIGILPGGSIVVSATGSSVGGTVDCTGCDEMYIVNTSATLYVAVRFGVGAQTAVITTDLILPPLGTVIVGVNSAITGVAAIGSAAGPTIVGFTPILRGR
ncbi:MAG: hypothetical protein FJX78_06125 [Armatimonadetes bacterium]|nr:hypothetical protein [Armatimonadota bacterium]